MMNRNDVQVLCITAALALCPAMAAAQTTAPPAAAASAAPPADAATPPAGQEGPAQGGDPPGSNSDQPTDKPSLRAFCTDRPSKANVACTVDQGHFQLETDLYNTSIMNDQGVHTTTDLYTNPTLKYGLTNTTDVQVNWAPYESVRTHDVHSGTDDTVSGVGDLYLRAKIALVGDNTASFAATLFPYVKAPTARSGIGDGAWEGGLIVPLVIKLNGSLNLTFNPEFDLFKNTADDGRHVNMAQLINLSWSLPANVNLIGEFWSDVNFDPTGSITQYSADLAVTWGFTHDIQLDAGVNVGLNRATPAVQAYTGISHRF